MDNFLFFSKNLGFWVFLVHPTSVLVLLSASVERCFVSRMQDFFRFVFFDFHGFYNFKSSFLNFFCFNTFFKTHNTSYLYLVGSNLTSQLPLQPHCFGPFCPFQFFSSAAVAFDHSTWYFSSLLLISVQVGICQTSV